MLRSFFAAVRRYWLHGLVGLALAVALVYVEEDWRGAHAWAAEKAAWEAKGESFDRTKFVPPPVPEKQNLAALPLFKLEPVKGTNGKPYLSLVTLRKAMRAETPANEIPEFGKWSFGELPDLPKLRAAIRSNYDSLLKGTPAPGSTLAQFDAIYPFLAELRTGSATRPYFRLDMDYTADPPYERFLGPLTDAIRLSKLLAMHAVLALHENRSDLAIADLKLNQILLDGAQRDPSLVGGLVAIGTRAIINVAVYDGLAEHLWTDSQLVEIESLLKPLDFLAAYQFAMRTEVLFSIGTIEYDRQPQHRTDLDKLKSPEDRSTMTAADLFASGWWDDNERQFADFYFQELSAADPKARRIFPEVALKLKLRSEQTSEKWNALAPWNFFFVMLSPGISLAVQKYAEGQVSVDETRIACALERFHLAHQVYPATLAELVRAYLDEVPHDVMNGEPYHYRLNVDGTFLLYSVGWNQSDEGGTVVVKTGDPKQIDYEKGDWVWPATKK